ncbi:MAG: sugar transferase, partial [Aeromicrobium sp.]
GDVADVVQCAVDQNATVIIVAASDAAHPDMVRRLGWELEGHDIDLIVAPALANIAGPRVHIRPVAGLPLLHVERPAYQGAQRSAKTMFDRLGSLFLIVCALPILIPAAIAVGVTSRGPIIFLQERAGRDGATFKMFKFRTMVDGADDMLGSLDRQPDAGNEFMFKVKDDPRVTRVGKFLRRFSIDELPQLFNVLLGDMSLVGPRPPLQREVDGYHIDARRRLLMRPGITGLWQISGRSDLNWEETVRLDLYYIENWSMMGDLVILWRTARAVLSSRGAY